MARTLQLDRGNLIKKLKEVEQMGLFQSEFRGNQKYYRLNKKCPFYKEYRGLVRKTIGLESQLANILKKTKGVQQAWIFGSYAKDQMDALSDIDLLIVGARATITIYEQLAPLRKKMGRPLNAVIMSPKDFNKKMLADDPFLKDIFEKPVIKIL